MKQPAKPFARCVDNTDYMVSLVPGNIYRIIPDPRAAKHDFVRIVDESGEDYLYHKSHFLFVDFPRAVTKRILAIEHTGEPRVRPCPRAVDPGITSVILTG